MEEIENALKCLEMDMLDNTQIELLLNYIGELQKELEEKTTILMAGAEKVKQLEKENTELKDNQLWSEATIEGLKERFIPKEKVDCKIKELKEEESKIKNKGTLLIDEEKKTISHYGVEGMNDVINLVAIRKEIDFLEKISNKE